MKIPDFANIGKRITSFLPKENIEKIIFKVLLGTWLAILLAVIILGAVVGAREDIERKIMETATSGKAPLIAKSDSERYESLLNLAKRPEEIEKYAGAVERDPFLEYGKEIVIRTSGAMEYDFVLKSVGEMQLPLVYKGYIELPDRIIGQVNWRDETRFVTVNSAIDGFKINTISKEKMTATDKDGEKIEFKLNKPVFSDELQAMLYDNISKKTFVVSEAGKIDNYEVVEIGKNHIILKQDEIEVRVEKSP